MAPVIIRAASIWMHSKFLLFSIEQLSHIMLAYSKSDLMSVEYSFNNDNLSNMNRDILGVSVHLPCQVVYLCDNRIEIRCKFSPLYLFS